MWCRQNIPYSFTMQVNHGMMTSSNEIIFRVTGHLFGEFTVTGEFLTQRPLTRSFDVFFDLRLTKRLSKQWWGWGFETPPWPLWRRRNGLHYWEFSSVYKFHIPSMPCVKYCIKFVSNTADEAHTRHRFKVIYVIRSYCVCNDLGRK